MSNQDKKYSNFSVNLGEYHPSSFGSNTAEKLPPGMYTPQQNPMTGAFWFEKMMNKHDAIIDLPSKEYDQVVSEMEFFLKPEVKEQYKKFGYLYKRSALLHGLPGTGKTVIVNRVANHVMKTGGVCLFVNEPYLIQQSYDVLNAIQPETTCLTVLEEIDSMMARGRESTLLSILDGEVQKENVMYLATTNYIDKIPGRIMRPGRFSSVVEIPYPTKEARKAYLEIKLGKEFKFIPEFVEKSEGLSIDELKEIVQAVIILRQPIDNVVSRIKQTRGVDDKGDVEQEEVKWLPPWDRDQ